MADASHARGGGGGVLYLGKEILAPLALALLLTIAAVPS
jgi:hypothetical protein